MLPLYKTKCAHRGFSTAVRDVQSQRPPGDAHSGGAGASDAATPVYGDSGARCAAIEDIPFHGRRVVVKAGASLVIGADGYPSLRRVGHLVEQLCALRRDGREVVLVSSGAAGIGQLALQRQVALWSTPRERLHMCATAATAAAAHHGSPDVKAVGEDTSLLLGGVAAIGQTHLMHLYAALFAQMDTPVSSLLFAASTFAEHGPTAVRERERMRRSVELLLAHGVLPVINENDPVTASVRCCANTTAASDDDEAWEGRADPCVVHDDADGDNNGLAIAVAQLINADVLAFSVPPPTPRPGVDVKGPLQPSIATSDASLTGLLAALGAQPTNAAHGHFSSVAHQHEYQAALRAVSRPVSCLEKKGAQRAERSPPAPRAAVLVDCDRSNALVDVLSNGDSSAALDAFFRCAVSPSWERREQRQRRREPHHHFDDHVDPSATGLSWGASVSPMTTQSFSVSQGVSANTTATGAATISAALPVFDLNFAG